MFFYYQKYSINKIKKQTKIQHVSDKELLTALILKAFL